MVELRSKNHTFDIFFLCVCVQYSAPDSRVSSIADALKLLKWGMNEVSRNIRVDIWVLLDIEG